MQNASLSRADKSRRKAGVQGKLGMAAAAGQMGDVGNAVRRHVSAATAMEETAEDASDGDDFGAWAALCKEKSDQEGAWRAQTRKVGES